MNNNSKTSKLAGDLVVDDRGTLRFVNDFDFKNVKRFYQVENFDTNMIRAFHGHKKEGKYVYVGSGSILLCVVFLDNVDKPSKEAMVERFVLSDKKPQIVYIPPSFANGFKALEPNTKVIFYSTSTLKESTGDDYRYPYDYWGEQIWVSTNR